MRTVVFEPAGAAPFEGVVELEQPFPAGDFIVSFLPAVVLRDGRLYRFTGCDDQLRGCYREVIWTFRQGIPRASPHPQPRSAHERTEGVDV